MLRFTIPYAGETFWQAVGRNGFTRQHGIELSQHIGHHEGQYELWLEPINSRTDITKARIVVPMDALPTLIEHLQAMLSEEPANV